MNNGYIAQLGKSADISQSLDPIECQRKYPVSFLNQFPYTTLPKHVLWLSLPQQLEYGSETLSSELDNFYEYVKVCIVERIVLWLLTH